ncbi:MAG TPA: hypothetical protein VHW44_14420 [Pseudonocardiaceae bacterium]|jgi:hypothetical protein|nr:hypothetical protein [Pseudonocardiaceae bacterium]
MREDEIGTGLGQRKDVEMKAFLLGLTAGYVLGTRAGRQRYDQLVQIYRKVADHPMVQGAAGVLHAKISEKTGRARQGRSLNP